MRELYKPVQFLVQTYSPATTVSVSAVRMTGLFSSESDPLSVLLLSYYDNLLICCTVQSLNIPTVGLLLVVFNLLVFVRYA